MNSLGNAAEMPANPVLPRQLSKQVADHLRQQIRNGILKIGEPLLEKEVSNRLGVSRTPIREAIRELASQGFVELTPNHTAVVRRFSPDELREIYEVREALEGMAAELACRWIQPGDIHELREMQRQVEQSSGEDHFKACCQFDEALHHTIAVRSGNTLMAAKIGKFHDLVQMIRMRVGNRYNALSKAFVQHVEILDALEARDARRARRAMVRHIRTTSRLVRRCIEDPTESPPRKLRSQAQE